MIPVSLWSIPLLLLLLGVPLLGVVLTLWLLGAGLHYRLQRGAGEPVATSFFTRRRWVLMAVAVLCNLWAGFEVYTLVRIQDEVRLAAHYRHSRSQFVLPQDFQYGELLIPRGSLIDRYDAFDNGEPQRPLGLAGLRSVRFAHPVQVAGVWATAMEAFPGRLELAQDQAIRPVFHYDQQARDWVLDPNRTALHCRQGTQALFHTPLIKYDITAEFGKPDPDGPQARFRPSQWAVTQCDGQPSPIHMPAAYAGPAPKGAQPDVWAPTPPGVAGASVSNVK